MLLACTALGAISIRQRRVLVLLEIAQAHRTTLRVAAGLEAWRALVIRSMLHAIGLLDVVFTHVSVTLGRLTRASALSRAL